MQTRNNNQSNPIQAARGSTQLERARRHAIGVSAVLMFFMLAFAVGVTALAINPWRPSGERDPGGGQEVMVPIVFSMPFNVGFDIIKGYSETDLQWNETAGQWQGHRAIKIAVGQGTPVLATYAGTITNIINDSLEGTIIEIMHRDGVMTRYMGLGSNVNVQRNQIVQRGQQIGVVGGRPIDHKDGPHVKLEVLKNGVKVNPADFIPNLDGGNK